MSLSMRVRETRGRCRRGTGLLFIVSGLLLTGCGIAFPHEEAFDELTSNCEETRDVLRGIQSHDDAERAFGRLQNLAASAERVTKRMGELVRPPVWARKGRLEKRLEAYERAMHEMMSEAMALEKRSATAARRVDEALKGFMTDAESTLRLRPLREKFADSGD